MLDFSWSELALIGVVALVVIGPKDLPKALRTAGIWVRKARTISREFQSSIEQMMREAELDEVKKQIESVSSVNIAKEIEKAVDPTGDLAESLKPPEMPDLDAMVNETTPPAPAQIAATDPAAAATPAAEPGDKPATAATNAATPNAAAPNAAATETPTPETATSDSPKPASAP